MSDAGEKRREAQVRQERRGGSHWLWALLIMSLSVNMLIVGAIGAMAWMHFNGGPERFGWMERMHEKRFGPWAERREARRRFARLRMARPGLLTASMRWMMRELPEQRRAVLLPVLDKHRQSIAEALAEVAQARQRMLALIRREPLDEAALRAELEALHGAELRARRHILAMIGDFVARLAPEERQRFAEIVRRKAERRHWRRGF